MYLELSFRAPPAEAMKFAAQFCNGVLHPGYDPFDAVDISIEQPNAHFIELHAGNMVYMYYSYSPNVPKTTLGNRCAARLRTPTQIRIDSASEASYHVKVQRYANCPPFLCKNDQGFIVRSEQ